MTAQDAIAARLAQTEYNADELDAIGRGEFFYPDSPRLPAVWWRGFDRIYDVMRGEGGGLSASWQIPSNLPLFDMHFPGQPVLPGVFALDQVQMLTGAMLSGMGYRGLGLAKGGSRYNFQNMITPKSKEVIYRSTDVRIAESPVRVKITANGQWHVDDKLGGKVEDILVQVVFPHK